MEVDIVLQRIETDSPWEGNLFLDTSRVTINVEPDGIVPPPGLATGNQTSRSTGELSDTVPTWGLPELDRFRVLW